MLILISADKEATHTQKWKFNEIWIKCVVIRTFALCKIFFMDFVMVFVHCKYTYNTILFSKIATSAFQVFQVVFGTIRIYTYYEYILWNLIYCQYHHSYYMPTDTIATINNIKWLAMIRSSSTLLSSYRFNIYINPTKKNKKKRKICFAFLLSALPTKNLMIYFDFLFIYLFLFLSSIWVWWWWWSNQWHRFYIIKYTSYCAKYALNIFLAVVVLVMVSKFVRIWHLIINIWNKCVNYRVFSTSLLQ